MVFVMIFAPTVSYPYILAGQSFGMPAIDPRQVAAGYLVVLLIGAFYLSVGLLMSVLSRSQVVAAIGTFAVLAVMFLLVGTVDRIMGGGTATLLSYFSAFEHVQDFSRGVIDSRPVVLYLSCTGLTLFASVKVLESRRWL